MDRRTGEEEEGGEAREEKEEKEEEEMVWRVRKGRGGKAKEVLLGLFHGTLDCSMGPAALKASMVKVSSKRKQMMERAMPGHTMMATIFCHMESTAALPLEQTVTAQL